MTESQGGYGPETGYNRTAAYRVGRDAPDNDEIDLGQLWDILVDYRWWLLGFMFAGLLLGLVYLYQATPIYRAQAMLQIENGGKTLPGLAEMTEMFSQGSEAKTQIYLIRSRLVLGQVVDQLNLDIQVHPKRSWWAGLFGDPNYPGFGEEPAFAAWREDSHRLALAEFQVPTRLRGEPFTLKVTGHNQYKLFRKHRLLLTGTTGQRVTQSGITIKVQTLAVPAGSAFIVSQTPLFKMIQTLNHRLSVGQKGEETGILALSFTHPSPARAEAILGAIAHVYQQQNLERQSARAQQSIAFLKKQLEEAKANLNAAQQALTEYRTKTGSANLKAKTTSILKRMVQIEARLSQLAVKENQLQQLYTKAHPKYQALLAQQRSLRQEKQRLQETIESLPETQQKILQLRRDMKVSQKIYLNLRNKLQKMRMIKAGTVSNVRIIEKALTAPEPVKPRPKLILLASVVLGALAGLVFVTVRTLFNRTITSPEELERLGLNVYASIPMSQKQQQIERQRTEQGNPIPGLLAVDYPSDLTVEALRGLRTSMHFAMMDAYSNVLMFSGPTPGIGKSFVTANLGVILAQAGQRVLLVDADLRKGHVHERFGMGGQPGLSNYLAGNAGREEVVHNVATDNLYFIARGDVPPNPSDLLMSERMPELLGKLGNQYDIVIVDTPPILAVTDPAIIGQYVGACMTIVRYGSNYAKELEIAQKRFEQNGIRVRGTILNGLKPFRSNVYGYYPYVYRGASTPDKGSAA